jgi:Holliday junction resolvasome RuvABC DNA-binding subunit
MLEKGTESPLLARNVAGDMNAKAMIADVEQKQWEIRRKPWAECSIEEKIEKLRMAERENQRSLGYVAQTARRALNLAEEHQHSHSGEVLKPARDRNSGADCANSIDPLA